MAAVKCHACMPISPISIYSSMVNINHGQQ